MNHVSLKVVNIMLIQKINSFAKQSHRLNETTLDNANTKKMREENEEKNTKNANTNDANAQAEFMQVDDDGSLHFAHISSIQTSSALLTSGEQRPSWAPC
jgi:hypothetical protein